MHVFVQTRAGQNNLIFTETDTNWPKIGFSYATACFNVSQKTKWITPHDKYKLPAAVSQHYVASFQIEINVCILNFGKILYLTLRAQSASMVKEDLVSDEYKLENTHLGSSKHRTKLS